MKKWYDAVAEHGDIVVSTRVRLARNLRDLPFEGKMTETQQLELGERAKKALQGESSGNTEWSFLSMQELGDMERLSLVERRLVSRSFLERPKNKLLALSKEDAVSVMVNEGDHIRIQALAGGLELSGAYAACDRIDDQLNRRFSYAFDERLGYLTANPVDLGTGLRASVFLHLPALERSQIIPRIMKTVGRLGLTIASSYGEGTAVLGSTYQISNQVTLGLSEQIAIQNLENVALQIVASERGLRAELLKNNIDIIDEICRSYGLLKYARLLSSEEFYEHISNVRFGVAEHILDAPALTTLNRLENRVGPATVCAEANQNLTPEERNLHRAKIVREAI